MKNQGEDSKNVRFPARGNSRFFWREKESKNARGKGILIPCAEWERAQNSQQIQSAVLSAPLKEKRKRPVPPVFPVRPGQDG
jgi:hypothetical protein